MSTQHMQQGESLKVLVIEDNKMFLDLALEMLSGHRYHGAQTASDGLAMFDKYKPDITFLDIGLPDSSGHEVLTKILAKNPDAFVVMLTGSNLQSDVKNALSSGAKGYIVKPFSRSQVRESFVRYKAFKESLEQTT